MHPVRAVPATLLVSGLVILVQALIGATSSTRPLYLGPLACTDPSCPTAARAGGRLPNNTNFHLRDIAITAGDDGWYYLTGTSNSAGDSFWTDVWGVVRVWRSRRPLVPGSYVGGAVVFNLTRDCKFCSPASPSGGCRVPNSCDVCGIGRNDTASGGCTPKYDCGARVWAPELHYLPEMAEDVPGSGGWFITFHFHCAGGGSGVLRSTSGTAFGPFTDLVHGVPGGDVSLFRDPDDGAVYAISSGGGGLYASRLSKDMKTIVKQTLLSPKCGDACADTAIGFEGPFVLKLDSRYFLSASAYGNAIEHGGPNSPFNRPGAPPDSHYSAFMGSSSRLLGPYENGRAGAGSWLAVDNGGHNTYFRVNGTIYGTL
eukprot:UC1_evm1s155